MTRILNPVNVGTLETCPTDFLFPSSAVSYRARVKVVSGPETASMMVNAGGAASAGGPKRSGFSE